MNCQHPTNTHAVRIWDWGRNLRRLLGCRLPELGTGALYLPRFPLSGSARFSLPAHWHCSGGSVGWDWELVACPDSRDDTASLHFFPRRARLWAAAAHGSIKRVRFLFFSLFKVDVVLLVDVAVGLGLHYEICKLQLGQRCTPAFGA